MTSFKIYRVGEGEETDMTHSLVSTINRTLALLCLCLAVPAFAQNGDIDQSFDVSGVGTLTIRSDAGPIEVSTGPAGSVRVRVRNPDDFDVEFSQSGNNIDVIAESDRGGFFGFGRSRIGFRVTVPENFNLDLDTGGGEIEVPDMTGRIVVDTSGGRITIGDVTGEVSADTSGGRIQIGNVDGNVLADTSGGSIDIGDVTGDVEADTSGGSIDIGNVGGDVLADTSGGNITVGETGGDVELDTSGGTIRAAWAQGPIEADTSGGNIFLAGSEVSVYADTSGGNIEVERSNGAVTADTSGGNITIRQSVGPIRADTSGGRIDVELLPGGADSSVYLDTAGGDITVRIPANHSASIFANLEVTRRARDDYRIYTDFPLSINEDDDGNIIGRGDINGGGDRIELETVNSDIHIISVQ
ncbi:MAG: hypothetical protein RL120_12765 [Gammaproteobacteria bacterium]